ncbi:MAG: hypothetical protein LBP61_03665, partial [Desulfovibrio sp.]|nr:hypothetical protein [Desulfovibrio sp.]
FLSLSSGDHLARRLAIREIPLDLEKNKEFRRTLDLRELAGGQQGVFFLNLIAYRKVTRKNGEVNYSYVDSESRLVVLSDIGITCRLFPSGVTVFASGLSTGKPLAGAQVRLYSRSNQLLAEGKTTPGGLFLFSRDEPWDPQLLPHVATVNTEADISFLPLDFETRVSLQDTGERPYLDKGYEAFLYTPRGVFRPGETVDVKALVRDANQTPPRPFPVIFSLTSPRGLEIARSSARLSDQGGAAFAFALPSSAPTGEYSLSLTVPGQEKAPLGTVRFSVEDFTPPRLEVSVAPARELLTGKTSLPVTLTGNYLFGAPGANLRYELGYRLSPRGFSPEGWEGYVFGNQEKRASAGLDLRCYTGALGADGSTEVAFLPPDWDLPAGALIQLVGSVQEDSGRWVTQTSAVSYFPTPYLLGLKVEGSPAPGQEASLLTAAVDPDGRAVDAGPLSVEISQVRGNWHTVLRNGRYVYTWSEHFLPLLSSEIPTRDGRGRISFTPPRSGAYLVRCATADGAVVAARRIYIWAEGEIAGEEGSGRMDQVILTLDKKEYRSGETARLSVKAPYAGTLFLGVERGGQLLTRVLSLDAPAAEVDIPVTEGMNPNVTITAWVYRPMDQKNKEWFSHRAYGSIPLVLSRALHSLSVEARAPERAEPGKGLPISFSVKDADGNPVAGEFSLALVDEGILSLTAFKTPDPLAFFMAQRRAKGHSYDGFDALLRPEARATAPLTPGGDSAASDYLGSLSTQQVFLAGFLPTVRTGDDGAGEAHFDIPEYSGKGRLMIVGAAGRSFASASSQVRFARDLVVEASAPRAVAPGDVFDISLKAFSLESFLTGVAEIGVEVEDGPLSLAGAVKTSIPLGGLEAGGGPKTHSFTVTATAGAAVGLVRLSVKVSVPGREDLAFSKPLEIVVRSPYPRISRTKSTLIKAGKKEVLSFPTAWAPGTVKSSLAVTRSPVFAVLPALEYLREYPYGCLEQTVSRAWPYLVLDEAQKALAPESSGEANSRALLEDIVARVASFQTANGGFAMWPGQTGSDPWKSVNAAFFLVEAKARAAVPAEVLRGSLEYTRFLLSAPESYYKDPYLAFSVKAYAAFVLTRAGEAPLAWIQHLSGKQETMWPSGRIFLAAAKALQAGNPNALRDLKAEALKLEAEKLGFNQSLESNPRNQALLLMAWSLAAPEDAETRRLCLSLAESVTAAPWLTTQDAGAASLAFGFYLGRTRIADTPHTAVITAAGKRIAEVAGGEPLLLGYGRMPVQDDGNPAPVSVEVGGKGQAYVVYAVRGVPLDPPAPGANALEAQAVWKGPDGSVIDFPEAGAVLRRGDRVSVELKIRASRPVSDVVLSFLLPGGMEVENPRLLTSGAAGDPPAPETLSQREDEAEETYEEEYPGETGEDAGLSARNRGMYIDLREDRLLLFLGGLGGDSSWTTHSFSMRAVSRGTFIVPPPAAEGMYNPEINATGRSAKLVVE